MMVLGVREDDKESLVIIRNGNYLSARILTLSGNEWFYDNEMFFSVYDCADIYINGCCR